MPWYVYLALKQLYSTWQRFFFTGISVLSVALGVWLLLVVLSVMGGFSEKIGEMTQDTAGDIQITAEATIPDPASLQRVVDAVPGVVASAPFAQGFVVILYGDKPVLPVLEGIDPAAVEKVTPLHKFIRLGSLDDLDDDSIILSSILAQQIGAGLGSKVDVYSPAQLTHWGRADEAILPRELTVVGIFEIGHQQLDKSTAIVTLRTMQDLYDLGSGVHGLEVRIAPGRDVQAVTNAINRTLARAQGRTLRPVPGLWAQSWKTSNADFLWAVRMEKAIMTFILLAVVVVAAFLTMSLLIVLVLKKTREIGLFAALGATRPQVAACFCLQGVFIGIVGTALGLVFGFVSLHYRNEIISFVLRFTGGEEAFANVYQFTQLPAHTSGSDLTTIVVSALVLSTLAGAIPALLAARLNPVEALRNE